MQAFFVTQNPSGENLGYGDPMHPGGRPAKHPRSDLGARIELARQHAGLSQIELAQKLGVTQQVVAVWERKSHTVRSDTLAKLAQILKVSVDELVGMKPPRSKPTVAKGRLQQVFEAASRLPRRQQEKVAEFVQGFVSLHQNKQAA